VKRRDKMSKISLTVDIMAGAPLKEVLNEAKEKAKKLDMAYIKFSFNGVFFAVSPQADVAKGIEEYKSGERKTIII